MPASELLTIWFLRIVEGNWKKKENLLLYKKKKEVRGDIDKNEIILKRNLNVVLNYTEINFLLICIFMQCKER